MTAPTPTLEKYVAPPLSGGFSIEADQLTRRFGEVTALDRVSVRIHEGEFFSLLGPSGCGKTTLLRMIGGLEMPDSGRLILLGRDAADWPAHQRPVNTVFQSYALFPHLNVVDNVAFGLRMKRLPESEIHRRVQGVMEMTRIRELERRFPAELSGGQKQRVALARAVVNEPKVLLLDEPLGALDLKLRKQLQIELHQLQRRLGITFIYVTHDQDEALVMSDRIAVMNEGRIVQLDTPAQLYERPRTRFVAEFLGACNLIEGEIVEAASGQIKVRSAAGMFMVAMGSIAPDIRSKVTLVIRPERIVLSALTQSGQPNRVSAEINDVIYSGAETRYSLCGGAVPFHCCLINSSAVRDGFAVGESVSAYFPPESLILLND